MCSVFDNEEVGSGTKQGAGSTFGADVLKYNVVQIWEKIHKTEKVPFTIGVEDIPIGNVHENIKVKVDGKLTKK